MNKGIGEIKVKNVLLLSQSPSLVRLLVKNTNLGVKARQQFRADEYKIPYHRQYLTLAGIVKRYQRMTFKDDITARIQTDFGENASKATKMLIDAINKADYLKTDRVIRCIIFLSKGNLTDLGKYIETATFDSRDVMFWAEYEGLKENEKPKRMRDFNKNFEECTNNVKE